MNRDAAEVQRVWRESARYWDKHRASIRAMFEPVNVALIEESRVPRGGAVLDVAGGTGEPSLMFAERLGAPGRVVCTDAVHPMVAAGRDEARRQNVQNIGFCQCVGEALPFGARRFDAAVCRFGVMFFSDPVSGARELLRVTKPGGRTAYAVWASAEANPFFSVLQEILSRHVEMPPAGPDTPGAFRFAEQGKLLSVLRSAGAVDAQERTLRFAIRAPLSIEGFWELRSEMSDTLREKLAPLPAKQVAQIRAEVCRAARDYFPGGEMSFPAEVLVVSGVKNQAK